MNQYHILPKIQYGKVWMVLDRSTHSLFLFSNGQFIRIPWHVMTYIMPTAPVRTAEDADMLFNFLMAYYQIRISNIFWKLNQKLIS